MNFKDYIQGKRHGREANKIEREAMNDPFLLDAIDGFDSVEGNHLPLIEELERTIEKKSKKKVLLIRYAAISIAASVALFIGYNLIFYQNKPNVKEIAQVNEVLSESIGNDTVQNDEIAFNQKSNTDKKVETNILRKTEKTKKQIIQQIQVVENEVVVSDEKAEKLNFQIDENISEVSENITTPKATSQAVAASNAQTDTITAFNSIDNLKVIKGKVVDESGKPIVGASVYFNDKNATITDLNGNFSLPKSDGQKIIVKYIGFQPKVVDIKEDTNVIQLQSDNLALNEVVVTGYGKKTKKEVTGSVATMENKTTSSASGVQVKNNTKSEKFEQEEFRQFILKNLKENICEGNIYTLTVSFKTDKTGKPYDVKIISSNCSEFEQEFLRIVKLSPEWTSVNKKIIFTITKP